MLPEHTVMDKNPLVLNMWTQACSSQQVNTEPKALPSSTISSSTEWT